MLDFINHVYGYGVYQMKCPVCNERMMQQQETAHHGDNAFYKCQDSRCEYGEHWHRLRDIREMELEKAIEEGGL